MTKPPAKKPGLGAALAATIESERQSSEDRFAKAERLHQLAAGDTEIVEQPSSNPNPTNNRPTRAPQDSRPKVQEESLAPKPTVVHEKVVRDTFSLPPSEHKNINAVIKECLQSALHVTKSEVIRAAIMALQKLPADKRLSLLQSIEKMRPGRPTE